MPRLSSPQSAVLAQTLINKSPIRSGRDLRNPGRLQLDDIGDGFQDFFGEHWAISSSWICISAWGEDEGTDGTNSGVVYQYDRSSGQLIRTLRNPSPVTRTNATTQSRAADSFGIAVAISGDRIIVGANQEDALDSFSSSSNSGVVYVFDGVSGSLLRTIEDPNDYGSSGDDNFGRTLVCNDTVMAVSAPAEDPSAVIVNSGVIYIIDIDTGSLLQTLRNPSPANNELLGDLGNTGYTMSISGSTLAVASFRDNSNSGIVYLFDVTTGSLLQTLTNPNNYGTTASDEFGVAVSINGDICVVGAWQEDDAGGSGSGRAYVFDVTTGSLLQTLTDPNPYSTTQFDQFGNAVSVISDRIIVAAQGEDTATRTNVGKIYVFDRTTYSLIKTIDADETKVLGQFGRYMLADDAQMLVYATPPRITLGEVVGDFIGGRVFLYDLDTYRVRHTFDNPSLGSGLDSDRFGQSLDMSENYLIVGAYFEDVAFNVYQNSGTAYIFELASGQLLYTLNNPSVYSTPANDFFGADVAISDTYAVVGAPGEDESGQSGAGKAYIYNVSTGVLLHTLNNPNYFGTPGGDSFGSTVATAGDYVAVGAPFGEDPNGSNSGQVYVFQASTGTLLRTLVNPAPISLSANDRFGEGKIAISGNLIAIGARGAETVDGTQIFSGAAYVFDITDGTLRYTVNNPGDDVNDVFGTDVALSPDQNFLLVGAPGSDGDVLVQGAAYLYAFPRLEYTLDNPNAYSTSASDQFGYSVAISGDRCIVGAYFEDDAGGTDSGKAYIFDVTTGALLHTLDNPNAYSTSASDFFGVSVAISGDRCIVGAYLEDDAGGLNSGKAYIFDVTTGALLHTLDNPNAYSTSAGDSFGWSVSISGDRCIVAADEEDDGNGGSGKAYIFDVTSGLLLHTLDNPTVYGLSTGDQFGQSVSISGDRCIVGAFFEDDAGGGNSGKAYIFDVTTGALLHTLDNPNAYGTSDNDRFGFSVAISGDRCIVGAYFEDDAGGTSSGKAYIFDVTDGSLLHTLDNPNAYDTSAGDQFGWTVSISGDRCIVGAYTEDDAGGLGSGKAYIFSVTDGSLLHTLNNPNAYSTSTTDQFGFSVAIDGDRCIVGAHTEDDADGLNSGKAYIFDNLTTPIRTLVSPNPTSNGQFGKSLAINNDICVVGAHDESVLGEAYVFDNRTGNFLQTIDRPTIYEDFGFAIAMNSSYVAVSTLLADDTGTDEYVTVEDSGLVHLYNIGVPPITYTVSTVGSTDIFQGDAATFSITTRNVSIGQPLYWELIGTGILSADFSSATSGTATVTGDTTEISITTDYKEGIVGDSKNFRLEIKKDLSQISPTALSEDINLFGLSHVLDNPSAFNFSSSDQFGYAVAISGDRAIVGALNEDDTVGISSGKAYIFDITDGSLLHTLDNPHSFNTSNTDDRFGSAVAIDGDRCIVGAIQEDDASGTSSGKAYIFDVTDGSLLHILDNPNVYGTSASDFFGCSVSISGDRCIVGAYAEDDASGTSVGKAYIFDVTDGSLLHILDNPNVYGTSANDFFGQGVAISGDRCIVGAPLEDEASGNDSGKAYIFSVTDGSLLHTLDNPNAYFTISNDRFGFSVSISGDRCIVGAELEDDISGSTSGKAYIFNVTDGSLLHTLDNPNTYGTGTSDSFGISVAISGDRCIVGAYREDDASGSTSGKAYIFDVTDGSLLHTLDNPNTYGTSASDQFGFAVSISGDRAIVGANLEDDAGGTDSGKAYIFDATDGTQLSTLDNPNAYGGSIEDNFGYSVAISGDRCIVGAYREDDTPENNSGKAYIFSVTDGTLLHTLDNPNAYVAFGTDDRFGWAVAIDGDRCIVGAPQEDDASGTDSGKAYIFSVTDGSLLHTLDNPTAYAGNFNDQFGHSVAISGDRCIVSAPLEDDVGGLSSGKAYIFSVTDGSLLHTLDNPSGNNSFAEFGWSVDISGDRCIVGAPDEDGIRSDAGKAYIFDVTDGSLLHILDNPISLDPFGIDLSHFFGYSVSIDGDRCIIGSWGSFDAYIFSTITGESLHRLVNPAGPGGINNDRFGFSVSISGDRCIVGAYFENNTGGTGSGKAYIFDVNDGSLLYIFDNPNAYGTSLNDFFGYVVSINDDRCIVGAPQEDDAAGNESGKAYIFGFNPGPEH